MFFQNSIALLQKFEKQCGLKGSFVFKRGDDRRFGFSIKPHRGDGDLASVFTFSDEGRIYHDIDSAPAEYRKEFLEYLEVVLRDGRFA